MPLSSKPASPACALNVSFSPAGSESPSERHSTCRKGGQSCERGVPRLRPLPTSLGPSSPEVMLLLENTHPQLLEPSHKLTETPPTCSQPRKDVVSHRFTSMTCDDKWGTGSLRGGSVVCEHNIRRMRIARPRVCPSPNLDAESAQRVPLPAHLEHEVRLAHEALAHVTWAENLARVQDELPGRVGHDDQLALSHWHRPAPQRDIHDRQLHRVYCIL